MLHETQDLGGKAFVVNYTPAMRDGACNCQLSNSSCAATCLAGVPRTTYLSKQVQTRTSRCLSETTGAWKFWWAGIVESLGMPRYGHLRHLLSSLTERRLLLGPHRYRSSKASHCAAAAPAAQELPKQQQQQQQHKGSQRGKGGKADAQRITAKSEDYNR